MVVRQQGVKLCQEVKVKFSFLKPLTQALIISIAAGLAKSRRQDVVRPRLTPVSRRAWPYPTTMRWLNLPLSLIISVLVLLGMGCTTPRHQSGSRGAVDANLGSSDESDYEFNIHKIWIRNTPGTPNMGYRKINRMTPVLFGGLLIQGNAIDGLAGYNVDTGEEIWRLPIQNGVEIGGLISSDLTLHQDTLYAPGLDGLFYSVNLKTGKVNWTFALKAEGLAEPLVEKGVVYVLNGNNVLYALDAQTGKQLWIYSRHDTSTISVRGGTKPLLWGEHLFVGFSDGAFASLNSKNGTIEWEIQINKGKRFRDVDASPVMDQNKIYISSFDDKLYCINPANGEIYWKVEGGGHQKVVFINDKLYYETSNGEVVAARKSDGERIWVYKNQGGVATQGQVENSGLRTC